MIYRAGRKAAPEADVAVALFPGVVVVYYDAKTGKIEGDKEATRLLAREYRKGYELPDVS